MHPAAPIIGCALGILVSTTVFVIGQHDAAAQSTAAPAPVDPPKLLSDPDVAYPEGAQGEATVVLLLVVGEDGSVRSATSEGADEPFASTAKAAAERWRFYPASHD